jgi:hypothetical protein
MTASFGFEKRKLLRAQCSEIISQKAPSANTPFSQHVDLLL